MSRPADRLMTASCGEGKAGGGIQSESFLVGLHFYPLHKIFTIISCLKLHLQFI